MLQHLKKGLSFLDNKSLVDTIFSLGKLHQKTENLDKYGDLKFFTHFFREMQQELLGTLDEFGTCSRISEISPIQMAYLSKGLEKLSKFYSKDNKKLNS